MQQVQTMLDFDFDQLVDTGLAITARIDAQPLLLQQIDAFAALLVTVVNSIQYEPDHNGFGALF